MRKDQCFKCNSRGCYCRVVSSEDDGLSFDEVACINHVEELYRHSDEVLPDVMKYFISSTGKLKRGDKVEEES